MVLTKDLIDFVRDSWQAGTLGSTTIHRICDRLQGQHDRITRLMILNGRLKHRLKNGVCNFPAEDGIGGPCGNCEACKETAELLREGWLTR